MVGIVIVSHSARLADGVVELAREMAGPDVAIVAAGGLDLPDRPLGTDAALIARAIEAAWADDGVLVLMDLGSAVLSAEMAAEMMPDERRSRLVLCEAPLVEGAVAAAVAARLGDPLDQVAAEARGGLAGKVAHLAGSARVGPAPAPRPPRPPWPPWARPPAAAPGEGPALELRITVTPRLGLHARPAARFVQTVGRFDATVTAENVTAPAGPASARSLNGVATLGVQQGHEVLIKATGPQAAQVLAAVRELAGRDFDEPRPPVPLLSRRRRASAGRRAAGPRTAPSCAASPAPRAWPSGMRSICGRRRWRCLASPAPTPPPSSPGWTRRWRRPGVRCRPPGTRWPSGPVASTKRASSTRACFLSDEALLDPARRRHPRGKERRRRLGQRHRQHEGRWQRLTDGSQRERLPRPGQHRNRVCFGQPAGGAPRPSSAGPAR